MKIEIETKFNVGDIVYYPTNGNIEKCMVKEVTLIYNCCASNQKIVYAVSKWDDYYEEYDSANTLKAYEFELHTAEELKKIVTDTIGQI